MLAGETSFLLLIAHTMVIPFLYFALSFIFSSQGTTSGRLFTFSLLSFPFLLLFRKGLPLGFMEVVCMVVPSQLFC